MARPFLLLLIVAGYAVVYGTWRIAFQDGSEDAMLADAFVGAAVSSSVAASCWCAVRRCGGNWRVRLAWALIAVGLTSMALGFVINVWYQAAKGPVPYPSAADIGYLGFYPMMLVGLLSFPRDRLGRAERVRLALDTTIVLLSGVGAVWYLVLGPTVTAGGQSAWGDFVSGAYPVGSILLIFAASYALARVRLPELRLPIRVLVAGIGVNIVGDT
ncbi:MAG TPA: hypothetical protein VK509_25440, partial [Polyangiales bacterium]|nr:hypothetical protein [Polyangiales bacterium]